MLIAITFQQHPDSDVFTGLPALGELTGARVLAEQSATTALVLLTFRGLEVCAGAAPARVTRASRRKPVVVHRKVKDNRLAAVGYLWSLAAIRLSSGARANYNRRRLVGDRYAAAQLSLVNRLIG